MLGGNVMPPAAAQAWASAGYTHARPGFFSCIIEEGWPVPQLEPVVRVYPQLLTLFWLRRSAVLSRSGRTNSENRTGPHSIRGITPRRRHRTVMLP